MDYIAGLELTQEQESKLLIMAKTFLPKLQDEAIVKSIKHYGNMMKVEDNICGFHVTKAGFVQCSYPYFTPNKSEQHFLTVRLHWFEFCIRVLAPIITEESMLELYKSDGYTLRGHPVDLLYGKYKGLYAKDIEYLVKYIEKGQII